MKVAILTNSNKGLYNFRKELIEVLINNNNDIYIVSPNDSRVAEFEKMNCKHVQVEVDRRGINPLKDFNLFITYFKELTRIKPDIILTYTIKPNIYGGIVSTILRIPYLVNITGLGTTFENQNLLNKIIVKLYKVGIKNSQMIFFQNSHNLNLFRKLNIIRDRYKLIPGSGVNLNHHYIQSYPNHENIKFLFIGRVMKSKGITEYIEAAKVIKSINTNVEFHIIGDCEEDYHEILTSLQSENIIHYHGRKEDVRPFIKNSHAIVLPSYHEGTANVLLEGAAGGRPLIASNIPGCMEVIEDGISGLLFEVKNTNHLITKISDFINLPYDKKVLMGINGRRKVEKEFSREIVIESYLNEIDKLKRS